MSSGFQFNAINTDKQVLNDEIPENSISIFSADFKKHDDIKQMLDSNKDNLKLEAMKRIIGMIAKNKDASDLFPSVVKNVVSKNMEVKKLVYVYLMRYAEEQQDLALLSISTFQRALKDPNPLIRASALRVLSSIRVPIIVTIMLLAIKEAVSDMSPYVRKTAANAIAKLYSLDSEQKEDLISIIEKLLADKTVLVAGSAIHAFEEVCPERIDLIHKNFRKLCNLVADVDEWGQVIIVNMLTRYSRSQFTDPTIHENNENYNSDKDDGADDSVSSIMDPDHRLLLRSTKPLLQSRNSAVVMAVAQLYYYLAPKSEVQLVAKSLIRLLRSPREVQIVVLKNMVTIAQKHKSIFEPHLKSFYVHSNDSIHIKLLKLEILTCLATDTNISIILREFQTYVLSNDREFAAATIHAIGRCASSINGVTDACLNGLVILMSKNDETIVAESVVVIKRLLQLNPSKNSDIIKHMAKMIDNINVSMARASILWLIGEYSEHISKIAPDVLRKMAKTFCEEEDIVKLQTINLAAKLYVINPKQTNLLIQYVLNLAKYDQNYDIRDRARFLKALMLNNEKCPNLSKHNKKILLSTKPAPLLESVYKNSDLYQLGTLSHAINTKINGYKNLPEFPSIASDPTVRNVQLYSIEDTSKNNIKDSNSVISEKNNKDIEENFYSDNDQKSVSTEGPDPTSEEISKSDIETGSETGSETESDCSLTSSSNSSLSVSKKENLISKELNDENSHKLIKNNALSRKSSSSSTSSSSSSSSSETSNGLKDSLKNERKNKHNEIKKECNEVSLLDLDFNNINLMNNYNNPTRTNVLSSTLSFDLKCLSEDNVVNLNSNYKPKKTHELLNKINGNGLQIQYKFKRTNNTFYGIMTHIEMIFNNYTNTDIESIDIINKRIDGGKITILNIPKNGSITQPINFNFNEATTPIQLDIIINNFKTLNVNISCPPGELLLPHHLSENEFNENQLKLKGMNEISNSLEVSDKLFKTYFDELKANVLEIANMCEISSSDQNVFKFASLTNTSKSVLLLTIKFSNELLKHLIKVTINCEKLVIANMLLKDIKQKIQIN